MQTENNLKNISGQKIRRQFFNIPIYFIMSFDMALIFATAAECIGNPNLSFTNWIDDVTLYIVIGAVPTIPLLILSLLNRFYVGKIICVLDNNGLHYEQDFISWPQIQKAIYQPDIPYKPGQHSYTSNELYLTVEANQDQVQIELEHAPFMLLRKIKKHCPDIPCRLTGWGIAMILSVTLGLGILTALIFLCE